MQSIVEFWKVQNTGWSAGVSWFDTGGTPANPARFDSERAARAFARETRWDDSAVKWRMVHVRVVRSENQRVTTETFTLLRAPRRRARAA